MVILLALGSAISIGVGDFFGSLAAREGRIVATTLWVMLTSAVPIAIIALIFGGEPSTADYVYGAIAGLAGGAGLLTLYAGYAKTSIGIVGPITAVVSIVLPVTVGIAIGDEVGSLALFGIGIGIVAVALIGWRPETGGRHTASSAVIYGVGAGAGFGLMAVMLGVTSEAAGLMPTIPTRIGSAVLLVAIALVRREPMMPVPRSWRYIPGATFGSALGILLFTLAAQRNLTVSGLLLQMAYGVSAVLAIRFLGETSSPSQRYGFVGAVVAIALIAVG